MTPDEIATLINRRRRQLIVHSEIYYRFNDNIIDDQTYDRWMRELVELQREYPEIASRCVFNELFEEFDGSTGFHLCGTPWGYDMATRLLRERPLRERR